MTDIAPQVLEPAGISSPAQKEQSSLRRRIFRAALIACAALFFAPYLLTLVYVFIDPPFSGLMLRQALTAAPVTYEWRNLDQISPNLIAQVIAAEDGEGVLELCGFVSPLPFERT